MSLARSSLVRLVGLSLAFICGVSACKKERVLRLTYEVDVAAAYDDEKNTDKVMERARVTTARRLEAMLGDRAAGVSTRGNGVIVELGALGPATLSDVKRFIARSGRMEFKLLDDRGSASVFGSSSGITYPAEDGIEAFQEAAPDGLDDDGKRKTTKAFYARVTCRSQKHPSASIEDCLARFRAWAATLHIPADHEIGFEAVNEPVPDTEPAQFRAVGWRTVYSYRRVELTQDAIVDTQAPVRLVSEEALHPGR